MWECEYCGEMNDDDTNECEYCGLSPDVNYIGQAKTMGDCMITCNVCGCLNDPSRVICIECGSDLSDSPDWDVFDDDLNYDETDDEFF